MADETIQPVEEKSLTRSWRLPLFETKADAVKIVASTILGGWATYYCFTAAASTKPDPTASVLLCILSGLFGWILGIIITPSSSGEKTQFSDYGKTLVAAATGFFAGQYKEVLAAIHEVLGTQGSALSPVSGLLAGCCFLIGLLSTFIFRSYVRGDANDLQVRRVAATKQLREALDKLSGIDRNDA